MAPAPAQALAIATEGQAGHAYKDIAESRQAGNRQFRIGLVNSKGAGTKFVAGTNLHGADRV
jgi:hypothetical protein